MTMPSRSSCTDDCGAADHRARGLRYDRHDGEVHRVRWPTGSVADPGLSGAGDDAGQASGNRLVCRGA